MKYRIKKFGIDWRAQVRLTDSSSWLWVRYYQGIGQPTLVDGHPILWFAFPEAAEETCKSLLKLYDESGWDEFEYDPAEEGE